MTLAYFSEAIDELLEQLPDRWAQRDPESELGILCLALADLFDELSAAIEQVHADMSLSTAGEDALLAEWAIIYGAGCEQLPASTEGLRAYLQQRALEDGTLDSLRATLLTLLVTDANPPYPGGSGLTFPEDGSGLTFPADGSGLTFPADPWLVVIDHVADYFLEVRVLSTLVFDRDAFARAVTRANPAHYFPPTITESLTP